jgi:hypothetical protein
LLYWSCSHFHQMPKFTPHAESCQVNSALQMAPEVEVGMNETWQLQRSQHQSVSSYPSIWVLTAQNVPYVACKTDRTSIVHKLRCVLLLMVHSLVSEVIFLLTFVTNKVVATTCLLAWI